MDSRRSILHLGSDLLKEIFLLVVACTGGATDLARIMTVCPMFAILSDDKYLLEMVNFENLKFPESIEDCLYIRGLLIRCAESGNAGAEYLLGKAIIIGYSQLLDQESNYNKHLSSGSRTDEASSSRAVEPSLLPSFLSYFRPGQEINYNSNTSKFTHFELESLFMRKCNITDHVSLLPHVHNYVEHFGLRIEGCKKFFKYFNRMTSVLLAIVDVGRKREQNTHLGC